MDSKHLIACLFLILLYGCSSVEHVPTARVERDSIYMTKYLCDSIHVHDSIYVEVSSQTDTVREVKHVYHTLYRQHLRLDTLYVERTDTVQVTVPVERELSRWERTKMKIGEITVQGLGILCLTALVVWMIRRKGKQP